ncbi:hypothetical protein BJY01DRAFT_255428 [Aspergillus pseudoustus]|uniref:Ankyrin repeat-containing domain protein n=1 Tax=Aspergillus pseudoustus TaxID=1810923 RepID=A0ABR4IKL9_9EURO
MLRLLIRQGADIEAQTPDGLTFLHNAVYDTSDQLPPPVLVLQYLVSKGTNIHAETHKGQDRLMLTTDRLRYQMLGDTQKYLQSLRNSPTTRNADVGTSLPGDSASNSDANEEGKRDCARKTRICVSKSSVHKDESRANTTPDSPDGSSDDEFTDCHEYPSEMGDGQQ